MMKKWRIIFDYDDTLIRHNSGKELMYMAEYLGLEGNVEFERQVDCFYTNVCSTLTKGKVTKERYVEKLHNMVPILKEKGIEADKFWEAEIYKSTKVLLVSEGTQELLEYLLFKGYYLCILTNGFYNEQIASISAQGLKKYFEKIYAWDNYYAKPDKRAFIRAMAHTSPDENIMVGNNLFHDIIPAKKLGVHTIAVHLKEKERGTNWPDLELENLVELRKYL